MIYTISIKNSIIVLIVLKARRICMNIFTVSLFGHREIGDLRLLDKLLFPIIKELITAKNYVTFLIGRNGEFDEYAASIIKRAQKSLGKENNEINLVLPYTVANLEYYAKYYDSIIIPECVVGVYHKSAITVKNRWMVEQSDIVIAYVNHSGGAYTAVKYAERLNKKVINLCEI